MATTNDFSKISEFIAQQPIATLGTTNIDNTPYGAIVYVFSSDDERLYFLTKKDTQKYKNLFAQPIVSLTAASNNHDVTLQASGHAQAVDDEAVIDTMKRNLAKLHPTKTGWLPPLMQLEAGDYVLVGIDLLSARIGTFSHVSKKLEIYEYIE